MRTRLPAATEAAAAAPAPVPESRALRWVRVVAWAVVPIYLAAVVVFHVIDGRLDPASRGLDGNDGRVEDLVEGISIQVGFGLFATLGALLMARRPRNPVGWIMAGTGLLIGLAPTGDVYAAYAMATRGRPDALAVVGAWVQSWYWLLLLFLVFVLLPLLFPSGRLPSRRWRLPVWLSATGTAVTIVLGMMTGTLTGQDVDYRIDNPIGIDGLAHVEDLPVFPVLTAFLALGVVTAVAAVVVRFRRSRGVERQQMKWFLFAVAPLLQLPVAGLLPEWIGSVVFAWLMLALPIAIAVAVLRYRLDGIDVVINRTLVYLALTAVVVGVYVLLVG